MGPLTHFVSRADAFRFSTPTQG